MCVRPNGREAPPLGVLTDKKPGFMRSHTSSLPARRILRRAERRLRRRPALISASLAVGLLAAAGLTSTAPASVAAASGTLSNFALASYTVPVDATVVPDESDEVSADVAQALADADTALAAAETIAADIAAAGLDIGVSDTSVDTAALEAAAQRLAGARTVPADFLPHLTDDVTAQISSVDEQVSGLRGRLDAALALKAEQEAAEKARLEAEAAAAARASAIPSPSYATGGAVGGSNPADAQATAYAMMAGYGWGDDQFACLVSLWNKESGWNYQAHNRSSGAYGIPQALPGSKMASAGGDWATNAGTQIAWGLGYITGRYGTPCGAWSHSQAHGWY